MTVEYDENGQVVTQDNQEQDPFKLEQNPYKIPWTQDLMQGKQDQRDDLHKQGRAYIKVTGQMGGKRVSGAGRMPLVATMMDRFEPILSLQINNVTVPCSFVGLGRPWSGLHTIDVVRRDAAAAGLYFQKPREIDSQRVEIAIGSGQSGDPVKLVYTINLEKDWIEKITFFRPEGQKEGELVFTYSEDAGTSFPAPRKGTRIDGEGMEWLLELY